MLATAGVLGLLFAGASTMALIGFELGPASFLAGLTLAILPAPVYALLALWLDRHEKEPVSALALAFLWGAAGATFIAFVVNSTGEAVVASIHGAKTAQVVGPVLSAPLVEETGKAAALFLLWWWKSDEFDNVVDGVVYAAMVGLGFATVENVAYYGRAVSEGVGTSLLTVFLRGAMGPFSHPLFTAMTGIGLGIARESRSAGTRAIAPVAGLGAAILLHAAWNAAAFLGAGFFLVYLLVMVPAFGGVLGLVAWSLARERNVLREHLGPYVAVGDLTLGELEALCSARERARVAYHARRAEGWSGWRRARAFQQTASDLAFHRWRVARHEHPWTAEDAAREDTARRRMRDLRPRVRLDPRPPIARR